MTELSTRQRRRTKEEAMSRVSGEVAAYQPPTQEEEVEMRKKYQEKGATVGE